MQAQVLDSMELERERGITIKAQSVTLYYSAHDGERYQLNMIDTPGHVDFSYEVSRSLAACDGALLVVDASQGVEAQSVANCYTAIEQGLEVRAGHQQDRPAVGRSRPGVAARSRRSSASTPTDAAQVSAKTGRGRAGAARDAHPSAFRRRKGDPEAPLQALIIDSWFDNYVGVVSLVRVMNGTLQDRRQDPRDVDRPQPPGRQARPLHAEAGASSSELGTGDVGFVVAGIKEIDGAPVGDTITLEHRPAPTPLPGFKQIKPRVFAGLFPINSEDYEKLPRRAREAAPQRLGAALRAGGLRRARLRLPLRLPRPAAHGHRAGAARARVRARAGHQRADRGLRGAAHRRRQSSTSTTRRSCRPSNEIDEIREPIIIANILVPPDHVGAVLKLCNDKRGTQKKMLYLGTQVSLQYELPLAEVVLDFFDRLKSVSRGYASFDYEFSHFQAAPLVKLDILINGDKVDALSIIVHRESAYQRGRELVDKMQELIPRQMFEVAVQAAIGSAVIARATVKALRKNVLAKCYGGDISAQDASCSRSRRKARSA